MLLGKYTRLQMGQFLRRAFVYRDRQTAKKSDIIDLLQFCSCVRSLSETKRILLGNLPGEKISHNSRDLLNWGREGGHEWYRKFEDIMKYLFLWLSPVLTTLGPGRNTLVLISVKGSPLTVTPIQLRSSPFTVTLFWAFIPNKCLDMPSKHFTII